MSDWGLPWKADAEKVERRRTALILTLRGADAEGHLDQSVAELSGTTGIDSRMIRRIWAASNVAQHPSLG